MVNIYSKKLVIFDLDGTLLNTIGDLAAATNYALRKHEFPTHPTEAYKFFVGNGINKLFERSLPEGHKTLENILSIRLSFLEYYNQHSTDLTTPFDGMNEMLIDLQNSGIKLAVASNKYHSATLKLVAYFFPDIQFAAVFGQREGVSPKPDPTIVFDILQTTGLSKEETLYIGDSGVDMQTAINAGIDACGVCWGFRPQSELEQFSPKFLIRKPHEILNLI